MGGVPGRSGFSVLESTRIGNIENRKFTVLVLSKNDVPKPVNSEIQHIEFLNVFERQNTKTVNFGFSMLPILVHRF